MKNRPGSRVEIARYFRQLRELEGADLFLSELTAEEAMALTRAPTKPPAIASTTEDAPDLPDRPSPPISATDPATDPSPEEYQSLRAEALACSRCELSRTRTQVVFSDGYPRARLMVVGEAPGAQEDRTGLAFVGPAGKFLDLLLASVGFSRRDTAYICNILKCRPPGNRNPLPDEIRECTPYLRRQIEVVSPEVILAVGTFSAQFLTGKDSPLGKLRGEVYSYHGVPVVVTYHPAALLRNPGWTRSTWDDLQLLRQVTDGT